MLAVLPEMITPLNRLAGTSGTGKPGGRFNTVGPCTPPPVRALLPAIVVNEMSVSALARQMPPPSEPPAGALLPLIVEFTIFSTGFVTPFVWHALIPPPSAMVAVLLLIALRSISRSPRL